MRVFLFAGLAAGMTLTGFGDEPSERQMRRAFEAKLERMVANAVAFVRDSGDAEALARIRDRGNDLFQVRAFNKLHCAPDAEAVGHVCTFVVDLALAIAKKVLQREVTLDHDLMLAMARVALDRLADVSTASIRLHPDDYAGVMLGRGPSAVTTHGVQIVADPSVRRGGCVVQSEFGSVDIGVATQIDELTHALFGDEAQGPVLPVGLRDDAAA